ncbi:unnamed protein product, partial [Amoebophrya sp. A120]|eukprot:GSA120T00016831001.1
MITWVERSAESSSPGAHNANHQNFPVGGLAVPEALVMSSSGSTSAAVHHGDTMLAAHVETQRHRGAPPEGAVGHQLSSGPALFPTSRHKKLRTIPFQTTQRHVLAIWVLLIIFVLLAPWRRFFSEDKADQGNNSASSTTESDHPQQQSDNSPGSTTSTTSSDTASATGDPDLPPRVDLLLHHELSNSYVFLGARQHVLLLLCLLIATTTTRHVILLQDRIVLHLGPFPVCLFLIRIPYTAILSVDVRQSFDTCGGKCCCSLVGGRKKTDAAVDCSGQDLGMDDRTLPKLHTKKGLWKTFTDSPFWFYRSWLYTGCPIFGGHHQLGSCCPAAVALLVQQASRRVELLTHAVFSGKKVLPVPDRNHYHSGQSPTPPRKKHEFLFLRVNISAVERQAWQERKIAHAHLLPSPRGGEAGATASSVKITPDQGAPPALNTMGDKPQLEGIQMVSSEKKNDHDVVMNNLDLEQGTLLSAGIRSGSFQSTDVIQEICVAIPDADLVQQFIEQKWYQDCECSTLTEAVWVPCDGYY